MKMRMGFNSFCIPVTLLLIAFLVPILLDKYTGINKPSGGDTIQDAVLHVGKQRCRMGEAKRTHHNKPCRNQERYRMGEASRHDNLSSGIARKTARLCMPFIANEGQMDEGVKFYAKTFGGTVFVTSEGEIVYALPSNNNNVETHCRASLRGLNDGIGGTNGRSPSAESGRTSVPLVNVEQVAGNKNGLFVNWGLFIDGFTSFTPSYIYNGGDVGWVKRSAPITTNHAAIQNPQLEAVLPLKRRS